MASPGPGHWGQQADSSQTSVGLRVSGREEKRVELPRAPLLFGSESARPVSLGMGLARRRSSLYLWRSK